MSNLPANASGFSARTTITDCWNKIGVRGNSSCPELEKHVHCRNCPVHAAAAVALLDRDMPADYLADWTRHVAQGNPAAERDTHSVVVFRIGVEWLALPTIVFKEIVGVRPIHSLPHRRNGLVLGLANIRGELLVCISLRQILQLDESAAPKKEKQRAANPRLLVLRHEDSRAACPVDEVYGVQRFYSRDLMAVPATFGRATPTYTKAVLSWQQKSVGLLDERLLFYTFSHRGLALSTTI
jgi:chemotaxis-related protein WspD